MLDLSTFVRSRTAQAAVVLAGVIFSTCLIAAEVASGATSSEAGPKATAAVSGAVRAATPASAPEVSKEISKAQRASRKTEATYTIIAGLDGEIFPVFASYSSLRPVRQREFGTIAVRIANSTDRPLRNRVTVQLPGWSDQEIQMVELGAGESRTYLFAPTFLPRLYQNKEIVGATALVSASDMSGLTVFSETAPVRLRSVDDIYWGPNFRYARFIASWVTPHDPKVEGVLSRAKEFMPMRRLPGYEQNKPSALVEKSSRLQAKAIYRALQERGVSYVKSSMTFGANQDVSERVRMPDEALQSVSANCIDGVVMYASLFENLGMQPVVVLVPGHAYVGVRLSPKTNQYLFLETALTGRSTFEAAVQAAETGLAKVAPGDTIRIAIDDARTNGIYPMPAETGTAETDSARLRIGNARARP